MTGYWLKFEDIGEDRIPNDYNYKRMKGERRRTLDVTYFPRKSGSIQSEGTLFLTIVSYDEHNRPTPISGSIIGVSLNEMFIGRVLSHEFIKKFAVLAYLFLPIVLTIF